MATKEKIQLMHPDGKKAPAISRATYDLFHSSIIKVLKGSDGMTYTDIAEGVRTNIEQQKVEFNGSVEWYTVCVKQHLESEGVIETYTKGRRKLHRLR